MSKKKKKQRKILSKIFKSLSAGIIIVILGTIGIDAVDHYDNLSESIAGRLIFGNSSAPCPSEMSLVQAEWGDFCIDIYEASAGEKCPNPTPENMAKSNENLNSVDCLPVSKKDSIPWKDISQDQAAYACAKAGKRLPSNKEWMQAALGTPDKIGDWNKDDCHVAGNWDSQPGQTGSGQKCVSFAGVYDMIGNVWEWVDGTVLNGAYEGRELPKSGYVHGIYKEDGLAAETKDTPQEFYFEDYFWIKDTDIRAIARGGYWDNESMAGQYSHYIVAPPSFTGSGVGFRCVKSPD
jgi:formylglycine-generating enzyme required for sulfatase activity